jgi:hypothetical protein
MKVHELIQLLQGLPDPDATVVIADGWGHDLLIVSGVVECGIRRLDDNPDFAEPGTDPGAEIV